MNRSRLLYRHLILFYLILLMSLVCCVPTEAAPDRANISEVSAEIATVQTRPVLVSVTVSPVITATPFSTQELPPTATATAVSTPIPTEFIQIIATETPIPMPTVTPPSPTPIPPFETPENALTCHLGEAFTKCYDLVLGIEFEYPNEWGNLTGSFRRAMALNGMGEWVPSGFAYDYWFHGMNIISGGRSRKFGEDRGGVLMDFSGFPPPYGEDFICNQWPFYRPNEICNKIKPNVFLVISLTNSMDFCANEFGRDIEALAFVALEIPDNDLINGFIFGTNILGADVIEEVRQDFPQRQQPELICDDATRQAFNQRMEQIAEEIINMTVTGETLHNLELLNHLAESIIFK